MNAVAPLTLVAISYLIGSIPFSYLVARLIGRTDIRDIGSGNVGATNVARSVGKKAGVAALLLDGFKGWAAVAIAGVLFTAFDMAASGLPESFWLGLAGFIATLGHMFPAWLRFRGGKGVATGAGVFFALDPLAIALALVVFLVIAFATRFVSLGSIISSASVPLILRFVTDAPFWTVVFAIGIALAIVAKHHSNIRRLASGDERRFR